MPLDWRDFATTSSTAVDKNLRDDEWPIYRYKLKGAGYETYIQAPVLWVELPDDPKELERYREHARSIEGKYKDDPEFASIFEGSYLEGDPELASYLAAQDLGLERWNEEKPYAPLDYPDLFLQFARLIEEGPITPEAMLGWAEQYGVLGLRRTSINWIGDPRGGPEENLANFAAFAEEANLVLRLYEMVTDSEEPDYEFVREHPRLGGMLGCRPLRMNTISLLQQHTIAGEEELVPEWMEIRQAINQKHKEDVDRMSPERLKEVALAYIDETIHMRVSGDCHPRLYRQKDGTAQRGWGFKSLLGAMWLQMMWLRSAPADEVDRCPWCRKTIAFERQPEQPEIDPGMKKNARKKYKTRVDKTYCDDRCKANWNYHFGEGKSSKHARKRERKRRKSDDN